MDINYYKKYEPIDGKWYINKKLGSGAFGTVFEIERRDFTNDKSALKIITIPASSSEVESYREENYDLDEKSVSSYFYGFVEEFIKEFQLMTKLKGNSNIVSIEDYDVKKHTDEIGWDILIRMELLTPMNRHFKENKLNQQTVIKLGIDICKALETCQKFKIIHRDIKPSNIFVSETGDFKLGDFGVARTLEKTSSGLSKKGTYTYMAPEVHASGEYGSNVDIYSLGIVMYKLLNNNFEPFRKKRTHTDEEAALSRRLKGEKIPNPANADGRLAEIVLKACSYEPKDRYESPLQMREELENILYTESEALDIYPNGDEVAYEPSTSGNTEESREKTESIFANANIEEDNATIGIFSSEIPIAEAEDGSEKTVSLFSGNDELEKPKEEYQEGQTSEENSKVNSKGIIIVVIAIVLAALLSIVFLGNRKSNQHEVDVINDIVALIEITDENDGVILDNDEITSVEKRYDNEMGYYLLLSLNSNGQTKFYEYTSENVGGQARIYINKMLISAPTISEAINTTDIVISGDFSKEDVDKFIENLHTEYVTEENQEKLTEEPAPELIERPVEEKPVSDTPVQKPGKTDSGKTTTPQKCSVCGSTSHTKHPTCSVCGSTSHVNHPTCQVCGSTSHINHPTCPVCGSTSHTVHPQEQAQQQSSCPVCGSKYHSVHPSSDAPTINKEFD